MDNNPFASVIPPDAKAWIAQTKTGPLLSASVVVVALGFFKQTRSYAVPIGVLIMALWFWKWQRQGGHL